LASSEMIKTRVEGLRVQSLDCLASKSDCEMDLCVIWNHNYFNE
jgi:hypothetical protein